MNKNQLLALLIAAGLAYWVMQTPDEAPAPNKPAPVNPSPCPGPGPCPKPAPPPKPKPKPWGNDRESAVAEQNLPACKCCVECKCGKCACALAAKPCSKCCSCAVKVEAVEAVEAKVGGPVTPDGQPIQVDLPGSLHMKNSGGNDRGPGNPRGEPGKGAGLCVFTSIEHAGRWQNIPALLGLQKWMEHHEGGGYPSKVDKMLEAFCKERGFTVPPYIQVENKDLDILRLATRTGRLPCITYGISPTGRYGGQRIQHMVNCPHATDAWFAVLDNNYPGDQLYEWLNPQEFLRSYTAGSGNGWCIIFLGSPPPPPPRNLR